jgi:hypothetical protein
MRLFKESYPALAADSRNIILGGCADGVSPFDKATKNLSMLCMVFTVFNLPPQFRDKYPNLLVWGMYEGLHNKHVHMHKFLAEDLKFVSKGFKCYDSFKKKDFTCYAKVLAFTADTPGLGDLSQQKGVGSKAGCYKCVLLGRTCVCLSKPLYTLENDNEGVGAQIPSMLRTHASIKADSDAIVVRTNTARLSFCLPPIPEVASGCTYITDARRVGFMCRRLCGVSALYQSQQQSRQLPVSWDLHPSQSWVTSIGPSLSQLTSCTLAATYVGTH